MARNTARIGPTSAGRTKRQQRAGSGQAVATPMAVPASVREWLRQAVSWGPYVVVFMASACGLVIEIVAARILAPNLGSLQRDLAAIGAPIRDTLNRIQLAVRVGHLEHASRSFEGVVEALPDRRQDLASAPLQALLERRPEEVFLGRE